MFKWEAPFFVNWKNAKVMDVSGGVDAENRNIIMYTKHGKINQQWDLIYADEYKGEPVKGELNEDFGLYVERPFYVISAHSEGRYLDLINNRNMVIKTRNGRKTQTWWFDQKSLTIKTKLNNQSWDIQSSGKTNNMQIWSTNSGWW
jgi:membrane carboxypeptidase/penicillin-binding protein PbpC